MADAITVRIATEADAETLLAIYEGYVRNTAVTFEYEVPTLEEFMYHYSKRGESVI